MTSHPRINVLGVGISAINLPQAVEEIEAWIERRERHYVNVCGVHGVMASQKDSQLRHLINGSGLATPDGMPLVWLSWLHGYRDAGRVYGPDLMLALCERSRLTGHRHFFYGGAPGVADLLARRLQERCPGLLVAGTHSPPYRAAEAEEDRAVLAGIDASGADVVWVGLGTPKQDYWVWRHRPLLRAPALIAVGAAFDFHAGLARQAPRWIQRSGLEWVYRMAHEPRRLALRYLVNNPRFALLIAAQLTGLRSYRIEYSQRSDDAVG